MYWKLLFFIIHFLLWSVFLVARSGRPRCYFVGYICDRVLSVAVLFEGLERCPRSPSAAVVEFSRTGDFTRCTVAGWSVTRGQVGHESCSPRSVEPFGGLKQVYVDPHLPGGRVRHFVGHCCLLRSAARLPECFGQCRTFQIYQRPTLVQYYCATTSCHSCPWPSDSFWGQNEIVTLIFVSLFKKELAIS